MSETIISPISFSWILLKVTKPDMFLKSLISLGGYTFGTGVTLPIFHKSGQIPEDIEEFIICVNGVDNCLENCLITFGGMSPGGTDLFS